MEKLIHKVGSDYISKNIDYSRLINLDDEEWNNFVKVIEKLGKIEELEEEIGLTLDFLLNEVVGKNIYYLYEQNYEDCVNFELATGICRERYPFNNELGEWEIATDSYYKFKISEFKKTWWLSEWEAKLKLEELKNEHTD